MPAVFVPLLSEHKTVFVWNRFFETLLGGLRVFLYSPSDVPVFVYVVQLLVHQTPFFLGAIFTILAETRVLTTTFAAVSCGATATITAACVQAFSIWIQRRSVVPAPVAKTISEVPPSSPSPRPPSTKKAMPECLLEDDDVVFESCCSLATVRLLFPNKRFVVNTVVHALLWGSLTGYGVVYMSPSWLVGLYGSSGVAYTLFFLGWMSACISLYSLVVHVPAESATFHPLDRWEVRSLNRPFYVALFYALDVFYRETEARHPVASVGHIVFVLLPLLWFLNLLPPLDALLPWLAEQILVWLGGGSPTASTKRLFCHLILWASVIVILYVIAEDRHTVVTVASAILGYLLSLDLGAICRSAYQRMLSAKNAHTGRVESTETDHGCWTGKDMAFFGITFLVVVACSCALHYRLVSAIPPTSVGHVLCASLILTALLGNVQSVYFCFGFVRNPLYPPDTKADIQFARRLQMLRNFGSVRYILVSFVVPLLLMWYVFVLDGQFYKRYDDMVAEIPLFHVVACFRAFRWPWQQTESALLETVVVHYACTYFSCVMSAWYDVVILLLLASFTKDRLNDFLAKILVVLSILIPSITQDKQMRSYSWILFAINVVCFPQVLFVLALSSLLSAPLLPLFTLPIFWIGFPRPTHFWPKQKDNLGASSSPDSIYYEEVVGQLAKELGRMIAYGSLGTVRPGDHLLLRYDDRLAFLSVSERGYGHVVARLKGLELQQTSCHAVEAMAVDRLLEEAFERDAARTRKLCPASIACGRGLLHVYRPCDVALVETYVDTRNVLTGVINSPETLQLISDCFAKCLIWILVHHFRVNEDAKPRPANDAGDADVGSTKVERLSSAASGRRPSTADKYAQLPRAPAVYQLLEAFSTSFSSEPDPWKDDDDPLEVTECPPKTLPTLSAARRVVIRTAPQSDFKPTDLPGVIAEPADKFKAMSEPEVFSAKNAWPWDPGLTSTTTDVVESATDALGGDPMDVWEDGDAKDDGSNAANFPTDWLRSPVPNDHLEFSDRHFPHDWFRFVCMRCAIHEAAVAKLVAVYRPLVLSCHVIVNQVRTTGGRRMSIGPCNVARSFNGDLPWSPYSDWLVDNPDLQEFVIKAYRYACKVALDQTLLGDAESEDDFAEYLDDYDASWHLGSDEEPSWSEAVQRRVPNLFCMGYNPLTWTHTSHLLTRRTVPVYVGRLNREMVRSVWSTLSLELLYLTNDDEERYSIQAHPSILRNLTVQGADPPLGYPVYVSEPLLMRSTPDAIVDGLGQRSARVAAMPPAAL